MNTYHITRIVEEFYCIDAVNEAQALKAVARENAFSTTIKKQTVQVIPPTKETNKRLNQ